MLCVNIADSADKVDTETNFLPSLKHVRCTSWEHRKRTSIIHLVFSHAKFPKLLKVFYVLSNEFLLASDLIKYHVHYINSITVGLF